MKKNRSKLIVCVLFIVPLIGGCFNPFHVHKPPANILRLDGKPVSFINYGSDLVALFDSTVSYKAPVDNDCNETTDAYHTFLFEDEDDYIDISLNYSDGIGLDPSEVRTYTLFKENKNDAEEWFLRMKQTAGVDFPEYLHFVSYRLDAVHETGNLVDEYGIGLDYAPNDGYWYRKVTRDNDMSGSYKLISSHSITMDRTAATLHAHAQADIKNCNSR